MKKLVSALLLSAALTGSSAYAAALPDLPVPFKLGAGAMLDGVIYAGLGTAGTDWYKLDTRAEKPQWEKAAVFTGPAREQSQAVVLNDKIYIFGGVGKASADATRISVLNDVYVYDPQDDHWSKVMTRAPRGLTGHAAATVDGKIAFIVGSVNKPIFDGYFEDLEAAADDKALIERINADYSNKPVADYFFNRDVLAYDAERNLWYNKGQLPATGTAGSALAVDGNTITVINGERKPGLRTAAVTQFTVEDYGLKWEPLPDLTAPEGEALQEGIAGAFAGVSDHVVLAAGGANFPGSTQAYANGRNFAHAGCTKTWRDEVYAYVNGQWVDAGRLPQPLGYGAAVQNGDEVILIGGETTGGKAVSKVITLSFKDGQVIIED